MEAKVETKLEAKVGAKEEAKAEIKVEIKVETKAEIKVETKAEIKVETKVEAKVEAKDNIIEYIELLESKIKDASKNGNIDMKQELKAKFGDSVLNMGQLKFRLDCPDDFRDDMMLGFRDKTKYFVLKCKDSANSSLKTIKEIYLHFLYFEKKENFAKLLLIIKSFLITILYLFPGYSDMYDEIKLYLNNIKEDYSKSVSQFIHILFIGEKFMKRLDMVKQSLKTWMLETKKFAIEILNEQFEFLKSALTPLPEKIYSNLLKMLNAEAVIVREGVDEYMVIDLEEISNLVYRIICYINGLNQQYMNDQEKNVMEQMYRDALNKETVEPILRSRVFQEAIVETEIFKNPNIDIDINYLLENFNNIVEFYSLPTNISASTTYFNKIFISNKFYNIVGEEKITIFKATLIILLLHELMHYFQRLGKDKAYFEIETPKNNNLEEGEAGRILELVLFKEHIYMVNLERAQFILNNNKWDLNLEDFQKQFSQLSKIGDCKSIFMKEKSRRCFHEIMKYL